MASTSLALFRDLAPLLCEESDSRVCTYIEMAAQRLTASCWGQVYQQALIFYAAHLLQKSPSPDTTLGRAAAGEGEVAGPVASRKAGDVAVSYANNASANGGGSTSNTDRDLLDTHYGRQFLALRDTRACGMPGVFSGAGGEGM